MRKSQKRPIHTAKETYGIRIPEVRLQRETMYLRLQVSKETYYTAKETYYTAKETYQY